MTKEEAIEIINRENDPNDKEVWELFSEYREALDMAIQALSQEPCGDTISRSDMFDAIGHGTTYTSEDLQRIIKNLPFVTQKSKAGHWTLYHEGYYDESYVCSKCDGDSPFDYKFCPNCGARMVEPQESEDENE